MTAVDRREAERLSRWREVVIAAARVLCRCDGRDWDVLAPWEQDRYARVAALVEETIERIRNAADSEGAATQGGSAQRDRS